MAIRRTKKKSEYLAERLGLEKVTNLKLIENGLEVIACQLRGERPLLFRVGKEAIQVLERCMVEALRGSNNLSVTGKGHDRTIQYRLGNEPWKQVVPKRIEGCKKAWRYRKATLLSGPPSVTARHGDELQRILAADCLLWFYDLLARIQTEACMSHYCHSKPIRLSDRQMCDLEWLHERVRNEFEHFVPKFYGVCRESLVETSLICLITARRLLLESNNAIHVSDYPAIPAKFEEGVRLLRRLRGLGKSRQ